MSSFTHKIEIGFGVQLTSDGKRIDRGAAGAALHRIGEEALRLFGGFTLVNTQGAWRSVDGRVFRENGRTLMVLVNEEETPSFRRRAAVLAEYIRNELLQMAVVLTISNVNSHYV